MLGSVAAALAVASGGFAGSGPPINSNFEFSAQPRYLTGSGGGLDAGKFTAASGSGSATHVAISFDVPSVFTVSVPTNCSGPPAASPSVPAGFTRYTCQHGTVNAGNTVTQFLRFTAPAAGTSAVTYTFFGFVTYDKGNGGAGGGGSVNTLPTAGPATGLVTVVSTSEKNSAGSCTPGAGSASTPTVSASDPMQTSVSGSSTLPCTWAFVGEAGAGSSGLLSPISFVGFPQTADGSPATWTFEVYSLPAPFKQLTVYFLGKYSPDNQDVTKVPMVACEDEELPVGVFEIPSLQEACLVSFVKKGNGARVTMLFDGGGDPGAGLG